jgi:hypothetical protein
MEDVLDVYKRPRDPDRPLVCLDEASRQLTRDMRTALNQPPCTRLHEAFSPAKARRLAERFEWHYTPKHGSWLNMAETELAVLSRQCLDRRIPDKSTLDSEARAWQKYRNTHNAKADWHFTTQDARVKLKRPYPVI